MVELYEGPWELVQRPELCEVCGRILLRGGVCPSCDRDRHTWWGRPGEIVAREAWHSPRMLFLLSGPWVALPAGERVWHIDATAGDVESLAEVEMGAAAARALCWRLWGWLNDEGASSTGHRLIPSLTPPPTREVCPQCLERLMERLDAAA